MQTHTSNVCSESHAPSVCYRKRELVDSTNDDDDEDDNISTKYVILIIL